MERLDRMTQMLRGQILQLRVDAHELWSLTSGEQCGALLRACDSAPRTARRATGPGLPCASATPNADENWAVLRSHATRQRANVSERMVVEAPGAVGGMM